MILTSPQSDFSKLYQTNLGNDFKKWSDFSKLSKFQPILFTLPSPFFQESQTKQKRTCFKAIRPEFSNPKRLMEHFQLSLVTWERHVIWWNIFSWAPSLGNVGSFDGTFSAEPGRPGNVAPSGNPASPARRWLRLVIFPIENVPSRSIKRNGFFARGKWRFRLLRTKNELFSIPFWQPTFRWNVFG